MKRALLIILTATAIAAPLILAAAARADDYETIWITAPGMSNCAIIEPGNSQEAWGDGWLSGYVSAVTETQIPHDRRPWATDFSIFINLVRVECRDHPNTLAFVAAEVLARYRKKSQ